MSVLKTLSGQKMKDGTPAIKRFADLYRQKTGGRGLAQDVNSVGTRTFDVPRYGEEIKKEEKAKEGAKKIDRLAENLAENFNKLKEVGGIQSAGEGFNPMEIPFAQGVAKIANTKAQSYRNKINSQKQAAKFAIMEATGMSAKAVDSNQELL